MTRPARLRIDVCVCTFRRPFLTETLRSLEALDAEGLDLRILVADNDETPSAGPLVTAAARESRFPIAYVHAPARNISVARNACLELANAPLVAFIDDDELASPDWLQALLRGMQAQRADAVFGPVRAVYDDDAPGWMRSGDFHSTQPVFVDGTIRTGYTCNVLMRRRPPFDAMRFRPELGRSGGEDTEFFHRLNTSGARLAYAPDAIVSEPVPKERASFGWLAQRKLRSGQTHGAWLASSGRGGVAAMGLAAAKGLACLAMAAANLPSAPRWRRQFLRATLHYGVITGLAGARQQQIYGAGASTSA
jgi:succinoglycan biosynthesis protein ExoM